MLIVEAKQIELVQNKKLSKTRSDLCYLLRKTQ